jgi:peptide/nickel transport system permease protein
MSVALRYSGLLALLLLISFALPRLLPGDPLRPVALGGSDVPTAVSSQARAQLSAYYGLNRPLPAQLLHFAGETARGNLGFSIAFDRPVARLILTRLPWTLALALPSLVLSAVVGSLLGVLSAWWHDRRGGRSLATGLVVIGALPEFVLGILLILALAVLLPILPASGALSDFQSCAGLAGLAGCAGDGVLHALLPVFTLTLVQIPAFFLLMRAATLEQVGQAYIQAARARGLSERTVALRHAGRNAVLPVVTLAGVRLGALLGGVIVVETLFNYPGLGSLAYQAALARDIPVLQAMVLLGGVLILLCNAAGDVARRCLDPRLGRAVQL